jgi:hypothetical protein
MGTKIHQPPCQVAADEPQPTADQDILPLKNLL